MYVCTNANMGSHPHSSLRARACVNSKDVKRIAIKHGTHINWFDGRLSGHREKTDEMKSNHTESSFWQFSDACVSCGGWCKQTSPRGSTRPVNL